MSDQKSDLTITNEVPTKQAVIIVAGGKGSRFGADIPKQFLLLNGEPIYIHTIKKFFEFNTAMQVVLVVPQRTTDNELIIIKKELANSFGDECVTICLGGDTRFDSVKNGLQKVDDEVEVIGVHDAVRPLVSQKVIALAYEKASELGAVIPVVPMINSVRRVDKNGSKAVDRKAFVMVQTPQCFSHSILKEAYKQKSLPTFTDDASVVEATGCKIEMVEGNHENIKITTPPDLWFAEFYLQKLKSES